MARYTEKQLLEFVYRADTPQKIAIAQRWVEAHKLEISLALADKLLQMLSDINKRIFLAKMAEYEARILKNGYLIDTRTGEAFACSEGVKIC